VTTIPQSKGPIEVLLWAGRVGATLRADGDAVGAVHTRLGDCGIKLRLAVQLISRGNPIHRGPNRRKYSGVCPSTLGLWVWLGCRANALSGPGT